MLPTHLSIIEDAYLQNPEAPAFWTPKKDADSGEVKDWNLVSYKQLRQDILTQALYWSRLLRERGILPGDVVTVWIPGLAYEDVALIYGISRAGYTIELVSFSITSEEALFTLASLANAKLLIVHTSQESKVTGSAIPVHIYSPTVHTAAMSEIEIDEAGLPSLSEIGNDPQGIAFFLHTSGSTSGRPKLVPWKWDWLAAIIERMEIFLPSRPGEPRDVYTWLGTACHSGQMLCLLSLFKSGNSMIQPSSIAFPSSEIVDMTNRCKLSTIAQFPPLFSIHLKRARQDPNILAVLKGLTRVILVGMALSDDDVKYCFEQGITLLFGFASTECGVLLCSDPHKPGALYRPVDPNVIRFVSVAEDDDQEDGLPITQSHDTETSVKLLELIVPSGVPDCPDSSLRSQVDGHFHSGDTFEEVEKGYYVSRGRTDDWIKLLNGGQCDTRAIESTAMQTCGDLISNCVAVGFHRPLLILFVEVEARTESKTDLKQQILHRLAPAQSTMWHHERILHERQIRVVEAGSLPRTGSKGNIRRKAVEEMFKDELDVLFATEAGGH